MEHVSRPVSGRSDKTNRTAPAASRHRPRDCSVRMARLNRPPDFQERVLTPSVDRRSDTPLSVAESDDRRLVRINDQYQWPRHSSPLTTTTYRSDEMLERAPARSDRKKDRSGLGSFKSNKCCCYSLVAGIFTLIFLGTLAAIVVILCA